MPTAQQPHADDRSVAIGVAGPAYAEARKQLSDSIAATGPVWGEGGCADVDDPDPIRATGASDCASAQSTNSSLRTQGRRPAGRECWESIIGAADALERLAERSDGHDRPDRAPET